MAKMTRGVQVLQRAGVSYRLHPYEIERGEGESYGVAVAAALGVGSDRLFKTLVATVDGNPVVAIVPAGERLGLKALARAAAGKRAEMIAPADAERLTGYVTGGISPFGQRKRLPVYVDSSVLGHETIYCSAGQRGLQVELDPSDLVRLLGATSAPLTDN